MNGAPDIFWHAVQWQKVIEEGSLEELMVTAEH